MSASPIAESNAKHAHTIVEQLLRQGVEHAVVSPGSRNTPLVFALDAAQRQNLLQLHVVLDERVAGFLALGLARRSGKPVALSCTSGSAGAHYLPAIMEASHAQLCLIALTADRPEELQRRGAPQTTEQTTFFGAHVHETLLLSAPSPTANNTHAVGQAVERAVSAAVAARKPVHINTAFREPLWEAAHQLHIDAPYATDDARIFGPTLFPSAQGLAALRAIQGRGLLIVGPIDGDRQDQTAAPAWQQELLRASERLDWPIAADAVSPLRRQDNHALKHLDILLRDDSVLNQENLDHLVVIGPWPTSKAVGLWLGRNPNIQVTSLPGTLDAIDPWHRVSRTVRGDLGACLQALGTDHLLATPPHRRERAWRCDRAIDTHIADFCDAHPSFEGSIARAVVESTEGPATLHISSSMPIRDVDAYADGAQPNVTLCASRGVNGIDGNIATTLGEALAAKQPAVLLIGDLAFRHDIGGLMHAANTDVALTLVVIDNEGGGIFRHLGVATSGAPFQTYFLTPQATRLHLLAQGCGARVQLIQDTPALSRALQNTLHQPGVDVLILRTDGEAQVALRKTLNAGALSIAREHLWDLDATPDTPPPSKAEETR